MSLSLEAIETAIRGLAPQDLSAFRQWFAAFDAARWDAQIESDSAAGKLDALAHEALGDYASGHVREL